MTFEPGTATVCKVAKHLKMVGLGQFLRPGCRLLGVNSTASEESAEVHSPGLRFRKFGKRAGYGMGSLPC